MEKVVTKYYLPEFIAEHDKLLSEGWTLVEGSAYKSNAYLQAKYRKVEEVEEKPAPAKRTRKKAAPKSEEASGE